MDRSPSKPVVLIGDPNPENVESLKTILLPDYEVEVAADTEETVRLASSAVTPGIILLNNMPPSMDILAVLQALKVEKATTDIPVLLITEPTAEDTEARGFELGAADYLTKPFKKSVVRARVRTHLKLKRYRDNLDKSVKKRVSRLHEEIQERRDIDDAYRALVEHAKAGIAIVQDFKVKFANPAFCKMIGVSQNELIGAHLRKFISEEEFVKNTTRYSSRIKGLNLPRVYKSQVIHTDGSTIDVELNVSVVPYGRSLAALVFIRDIREEDAWIYCR
jgi:PAS domain S-box-containing protein